MNATDLGTSALAVREVWDGIVKARRDPRKADEADAYAQQAVSLFNDFDVRIVPVERAVAEMWAELLPGRSKRSLDAGIAATARVHGLIVVTRNVRDFVGLGVRIIDPFHSPPASHDP